MLTPASSCLLPIALNLYSRLFLLLLGHLISQDEKWAADALNTRQTEVRNFRTDEGLEKPQQFPTDLTEQLRKLSKS